MGDLFKPQTVELIDTFGDDLRVVNAARCSFAKESDWEYVVKMDGTIPYLPEKDERLINYLAKHGHWTPFAHCGATFRVTTPIFVARQLFKHKVGLTENEVSRRYVSDPPTFWIPDTWRLKAEAKKQGSGGDHPDQLKWNQRYSDLVEYSAYLYDSMIKDDVCPEQARAALPQGMMTSFYWTGSLTAFARVYALRMDEHAQQETRFIAHQIGGFISNKFPVSWEALTNGQ